MSSTADPAKSPWPNAESSIPAFGGVGGGTNPAGWCKGCGSPIGPDDEEGPKVAFPEGVFHFGCWENHVWRPEEEAREAADREQSALRAVVEGLRTQLATSMQSGAEGVEEAAAARDAWEAKAAALQVRVDAVKALAAHREFESSLVLKSEIREALEGLG